MHNKAEKLVILKKNSIRNMAKIALKPTLQAFSVPRP